MWRWDLIDGAVSSSMYFSGKGPVMSSSLKAPAQVLPHKGDLNPRVQQFIDGLEQRGWFLLIQPERPNYFAQPLADGANMVGRAFDCDVRLLGQYVSNKHCRILVEADTATLLDLGSRNGTKCNGQSVKGREEMILADGDQIMVADVMLVVIKK